MHIRMMWGLQFLFGPSKSRLLEIPTATLVLERGGDDLEI
jgi:hypothetical protein